MEKQVYAQALFDFVPSYADELKTQAGDVLQVIRFFRFILYVNCYSLKNINKFIKESVVRI